MKKTRILLSILVAILLVLAIGIKVYATAGDKHEIIFSGVAGVDISETSWDETNRIHYVDAKIKITNSDLDAALNQTIGNGGSAGTYYIGYELQNFTTDHPQFEKSGGWIDSANDDIAAMKSAAEIQLTPNGTDSRTVFWTVFSWFEYNTGNGWVSLQQPANGKTNRQCLVEALGTNDLQYGVNYRVVMQEGLKSVNVFAVKGVDGSRANSQYDEYVVTNISIEYPVTASLNNGVAVFCNTVEEAVAAGAQEITLHADTVIASDLVMPEGTTLTVPTGITLTIAEGKNLTIKPENLNDSGNVTGSVVAPTVPTYEIKVTQTEGGTISIDPQRDGYAKGDAVRVDINTNKGYEWVKLTVTKDDGTDVTDTVLTYDYMISMQDYNITVKAIFLKQGITSGKEQQYDNKDMTFGINGRISYSGYNLETQQYRYMVYVNDEQLTPDDYTYTVNSDKTATLVLKDSYLETLGDDTYTLKVVFTGDASDETTFVVGSGVAKKHSNSGSGQPSGGEVFPLAGITNPQTDDNGIIVYIVTTIISVIGIVSGAVYLVINRKRV